jgi:hypothetical protein
VSIRTWQRERQQSAVQQTFRLRRSGTAPGHFRSYDRSGNRDADDRLEQLPEGDGRSNESILQSGRSRLRRPDRQPMNAVRQQFDQLN